LPPERRGQQVRRASPIDIAAFRAAVAVPGVGAAVVISFAMVLWFAGMEQTFRLFTADGFGMSDAATGHIFAVVGIVGAAVQAGLVRRLVPRVGEASAHSSAVRCTRRSIRARRIWPVPPGWPPPGCSRSRGYAERFGPDPE